MLVLELVLVLRLPAWNEAVAVVSVVEANVSCCLSYAAEKIGRLSREACCLRLCYLRDIHFFGSLLSLYCWSCSE